MKASYWLCLLIGAVACGPAFAQEEDDIDSYFSQIDASKDNEITLEEMKNHAWSDLAEDASERDKVIAWGPHIIDFLLADADDGNVVTRKEFRAYIDAMQGETRTKFSKKDWAFYQKDYLNPYIELSLKEADKDGDKALSKEEYNTLSDADPEEFAEVDVNEDGKLTSDEYKQVIKKYLNEFYDFENTDTPAGEVDAEVKEKFDQFDADGDGKITEAEWKTAMTQPDTAQAEWWGLYLVLLVVDLDDNDTVEVSEFAKFAADQSEGVKPKLMPADREAFLDYVWKATDTDKDGKIVLKEYLALAPADHGAIYEEEFNGMDSDTSGDVSRDELWTSFKQHLGDYEIVEGEAPSDDTTTETPDDGSTDTSDDPMWDLYKKEGRSWMYKTVSRYAGMENVNYMKYEVVKVAADHAMLKVTMLDKDKNPMPGMTPTESKIEFKSAAGGNGEGPKVTDLGEKTVTVEAGEFEAKGTEVIVESTAGTTTSTTWSHKKYPSLIVKNESKSDAGSSTMELAEFNE